MIELQQSKLSGLLLSASTSSKTVGAITIGQEHLLDGVHACSSRAQWGPHRATCCTETQPSQR